MSEREQPQEGQEEALQTIVDLGSSVIRTDRGSIYVLTLRRPRWRISMITSFPLSVKMI